MTKTEIKDAIIDGHRNLIYHRYDYDLLCSEYQIDRFMSKDEIETFRDYFLRSVYPESNKRKELEIGFGALEEMMSSPGKILALLKDSFSVMLKYRSKLPKLLSTGLKVVRSFVSALKLESELAELAISEDISPPYSDVTMKRMMIQIPDKILQNHINSIWPLYDALMDDKMLTEALNIIQTLLGKMERQPDKYSDEVIHGIKEGRRVMAEGLELFEPYFRDKKEKIISIIKRIERDAYEAFQNI